MSTGTQTDWSQIPAGDGLEDLILTNVAPVKSSEDIEAENGFRELTPGDHVIEVTGYDIMKDNKTGNLATYFKTVVGGKFDATGKLTGGQMQGFQAIKVRVKFAKVGDRGATIRDIFTTPPSDPNEHRAYFEGLGTDAKPGAKGGFHANKFYHFLGALGFDILPGQPLPPAALSLRNWIGRRVLVTVAAGKGDYSFEDKKTGEMVTRPNGPQIKMFSYRRATDAVIAANGANGHGNGAHGNGANGHAAQRPAALAVNPAALPQHSAPSPAKAEKFDPLAGI